MQSIRSSAEPGKFPTSLWSEVFDAEGAPRPVYGKLLEQLSEIGRPALRRLDDSLEATMREMGVTFAIDRERTWGRKPWECDLLAQVFSAEEWAKIRAGMQQRLRAFEFFLQDVYGERRILREDILPVQVVMGSPHYQRAACGLPRPSDSFLHLSGMALCRLESGELAVRHQYFGNASGISYMMQNRRALARVMTRFFEGHNICSIADAPTDILEVLRSYAGEVDPTVVLLSPGPGSAAYSEHSFLGRRMGIPVVEGNDLLIHQDRVFLKTITGLERVETIYTRLADAWLDPLVFRPDSVLGVAGLVQCIRKGSVQVLNSIGSQLADDRAILSFSNQIIRYYLRERPVLPTVPTYWLGEIDQREYVLANLDEFSIHPLYGERILTSPPGEKMSAYRASRVRKEIAKEYSDFVAQPRSVTARTLCFPQGKAVERLQDHIVFGLRQPDGNWEIFPGALTRVSSEESAYVASEFGGGSKDTWVEAGAETPVTATMDAFPAPEWHPPASYITSRVAESFYWVGRYLERASGLANMIGTIESLELEELNPTEQKLYRPIWNLILPPLENREKVTKRTISSARGRYLLALDPEEGGSVASSVFKAASNARSIQEVLSTEATAVLSDLQAAITLRRFRSDATEERMIALSRKACDQTRALIPQFFGVAESTMVVDGGWRFCLLGQMFERAIITANALCGISSTLVSAPPDLRAEHALEIRLSAFLRLLASRDAYRRIYQMRIEPPAVAALLWDNPSVPRSVRYCLDRCHGLLVDSGAGRTSATNKALLEIESLRSTIRQIDWEELFEASTSAPPGKKNGNGTELEKHMDALMSRLLQLHGLVTDGFLNHQIHLHEPPQPLLVGFSGNDL